MKYKILMITLIMALLVCCNNKKTNQDIVKVVADSLIVNIDKYCDANVEIEGIIVHVCGVNGQKMKLKTEGGAIIKIVPDDTLFKFDTSFYKKRIKVKGIVKEFRIEKSHIDKKEKDGTLLCHIDYAPCKDSVWVRKKIESGAAEKISKRYISKLRTLMEQTGKDYVSVITMFAKKIEIIQE